MKKLFLSAFIFVVPFALFARHSSIKDVAESLSKMKNSNAGSYRIGFEASAPMFRVPVENTVDPYFDERLDYHGHNVIGSLRKLNDDVFRIDLVYANIISASLVYNHDSVAVISMGHKSKSKEDAPEFIRNLVKLTSVGELLRIFKSPEKYNLQEIKDNINYNPQYENAFRAIYGNGDTLIIVVDNVVSLPASVELKPCSMSGLTVDITYISSDDESSLFVRDITIDNGETEDPVMVDLEEPEFDVNFPAEAFSTAIPYEDNSYESDDE